MVVKGCRVCYLLPYLPGDRDPVSSVNGLVRIEVAHRYLDLGNEVGVEQHFCIHKLSPA